MSVGRSEKSLARFFVILNKGTLGKAKRSFQIKFVCSDMWKPYLNVIAQWCKNALNILDRFHIKSHLTKAVDETRKLDVTKLKAEKREAVLTKSKYIFLKNPENLTEKQAVKLEELLGYNLRVIRAYLIQCLFPKVDLLNDFGMTRVDFGRVAFWTSGVSGRCEAR